MSALTDAIYDVLVEECGAHESPDDRRDFAMHWPECREYRFQGKLGFGGKVWCNPRGANLPLAASPAPACTPTAGEATRGLRSQSRRPCVYVNCYPEDETPERLAMIERANERLRVSEERRG